MIVSQTWTHELPLQQQAVLLLACRGCDGRSKHHGAKIITRYIRGSVLNAAKFGGPLDLGSCVDTFMDMRMVDTSEASRAVMAWDEAVDDLPLHFFQHICSAVSILRRHPDPGVADFWRRFYAHLCDYMHMKGESEEDRDLRLNDWGRKHWDQ